VRRTADQAAIGAWRAAPRSAGRRARRDVVSAAEQPGDPAAMGEDDRGSIRPVAGVSERCLVASPPARASLPPSASRQIGGLR
jgi:hypothetical protein